MTRPTVIGLVGFTAIGVVRDDRGDGRAVVAAVAGAGGRRWSLFLLLMGPFARDEGADDAAEAERPALGYERWVPQPAVLLLSTSDTDLITARASGADTDGRTRPGWSTVS